MGGALERVKAVPGLRAASVGVLALYVVLGFRLQWDDPAFYLYIGFACSVLTALLIAALLAHDDALAGRMLRVWPLVYCGRISYGLYLWHFPVFVVLRHALGLATVWTATLGVPLTFLLAMLSYRYVETPFLRRKSRVGVANGGAEPQHAHGAAIARHEI
jgi:peptidoglycan/LPS O-acetylase OafA/YrhL